MRTKVSSASMTAIGVCLVIAGCGPPAPRIYRSDDGNLLVESLVRPKATEETVDSVLGPLTIHHLGNDHQDGSAYVATWIDYPDGTIGRDQVDGLLDGAVKTFAKSISGAVRRWDVIRLGDHPGRDLWMDVHRPDALRPGLARVRLYFVGQRLYQVVGLDPESMDRPERLDLYVKSFRLLREKPGLPPDSEEPSPPTIPPS